MWPFKRQEKARTLTVDQVINAIDGLGFTTDSGIRVTRENAFQTTAVLAVCRAIALGIATPQLNLYTTAGDGKRELINDTPMGRLLSRRPNQWQTSFDWLVTMTLHAALTGNGISVKSRDTQGRIVELIPVEPRHVELVQPVNFEPPKWRITDETGFIGVFDSDDIFQLPNFMWNRVRGWDSVALAREAIGLAQGGAVNQAKLYANGAKTGGVLTTDETLSEELVERIRLQFTKTTTASGAFGTPILDRGLKYQQMTMTGLDAQTLETRKFQVEEICRSFGVFPQMAMSSDKTATFASAEAFFAAHVRFTVLPWQKTWVQRLDEFVLDGSGPEYVEFDNTQMIMGNMADRQGFYRTVTELGIYTRNEIRVKFEGLEPLEGLDEPLQPVNLADVEEDDDDAIEASGPIDDEIGADNEVSLT